MKELYEYACGKIRNTLFAPVYPKADPYNAIFINITQRKEIIFNESDGIQNLSQYVNEGDKYIIIPPTEVWLIDKAQNYFSDIIPPDKNDCYTIFDYDENVTRNIVEHKKGLLIVPSKNILDGLRINKNLPYDNAYFNKPYLTPNTGGKDCNHCNPKLKEGFDFSIDKFHVIILLLLIILTFTYAVYTKQIKLPHYMTVD